jgi:hypothetical protein
MAQLRRLAVVLALVGALSTVGVGPAHADTRPCIRLSDQTVFCAS